jgi:hypothetical protein
MADEQSGAGGCGACPKVEFNFLNPNLVVLWRDMSKFTVVWRQSNATTEAG